jgi:hypothetical protein
MLQELLNMEIAPLGSTHYNACRHSSMNAERWLPLPERRLPLVFAMLSEHPHFKGCRR